MSAAFAKVQRWLAAKRSKHGRLSDAQAGRTPPKSSTEGDLSRQASQQSEQPSIQILKLPDSPGEKRRSNSFSTSSQSGAPSRERSKSWGAADRLRKASPSFRRAKRMAERLQGKDDTSSGGVSASSSATFSSQRPEEIPSTFRGVGGEVIELGDDVLTGPLEREAYLQKLGRRLGGWKRRWFVLDRSDIAIYKNDSCNTLTGIIAIALVEDVIYPATVDSFGFTFEIVTSKRSYVLAARSELEALSWLHLIRRARYNDRVTILPRGSKLKPKSAIEFLSNVAPEERKRLTEGITSTADLDLSAMDEMHAFLERHPPKHALPPPEDDKTTVAIDALAAYLREH